jgi:MFS family permease
MSNTTNKSYPTEDLSPTIITQNDPRDTNVRWLFLFFACMLTFGTYYGHDSIGIFQIPFEKTFGISTTTFNSLSTAFYLPCTFMPILAGILSEKIGLRKVLVFLATCVCIGELVLALGVYNKSYPMMLAGRAVHGFGHDAMLALNKALVAKWFYRKDLALAIGLTVAVSRFGSSLSSKVGSYIYSSTDNLTYPFVTALCIGIFSLICCISEISIDAWVENKIGNVGSTNQIKPEFKCSDLKYLKYTAVLLIITFFMICPPLFCYSNNNAAVLLTRFGFDIENAGNFNLIFFFMATILTPLVGFLSDKFGGKADILIFAGAIQLLAHIFIIFTPELGY